MVRFLNEVLVHTPVILALAENLLAAASAPTHERFEHAVDSLRSRCSHSLEYPHENEGRIIR
jgi:hypothetical protein